MKYCKKPVVIEAMQFTGDFTVVETWVRQWHEDDDGPGMWENDDGTLTIVTLEGNMLVRVGDRIIRGVKGEFYPCKPDIFALTYEPADQGEPDGAALTLKDAEPPEALERCGAMRVATRETCALQNDHEGDHWFESEPDGAALVRAFAEQLIRVATEQDWIIPSGTHSDVFYEQLGRFLATRQRGG
jgi:hypothetical protein